ncbi:MAG: hypothetical protein FVQ79_12695 [Planctomycetes bacterium]|nr:hypothetical protein [Planctomycetota bacterium]
MDKGCGIGEIHSALITTNRTRCDPPIEFAELKRIADSFTRYIVEASSDFDGRVLLDDENPETIAAAFEAASEKKHTYNCIDGWSVLENEKYSTLGEAAAIEVHLRRFLNLCRVRKSSYEGEKIVKPVRSTGKIRNIMTELATIEGVYIPQEKAAPASLDGKLDPENIIALNNCMLDVSAVPPKVIELTKEFYTFGYLPFDYDPDAKCPRWEKFLSRIFTVSAPSDETGDELAISILQEWFGYLTSYGTYLQKIFVLAGPRCSGKSTIGKVLRALVGNCNAVSPALTSLAAEFGLQPLINKTLAIISDANISGKTSDITKAVERLKSISREDAQQINRRNAHYVEVKKLGVRIVMIANNIQDIWNSAAAIANRFNFLITTQSFLGREDRRLQKKLKIELPGIFNWSLEGLKRLRHRGYMQEHPAGIEAREDFEEISSPTKVFVSDWCVVKSDVFAPVDILWKAHRIWARENGSKAYSKRRFIIEIKGAGPAIKRERKRIELSYLKEVYNWDTGLANNRMPVLCGIDLNRECKNKWDGGTSGTGEVAK